MILYIGGFAQGKLLCARKAYPDYRVLRGEEDELPEAGEELIFDHFHLWFRRHLFAGDSPGEIADRLLLPERKIVVISDEVGNGIVPAEKQDRDYREALGRCLNRIADRSREVFRVYCGLSERIKPVIIPEDLPEELRIRGIISVGEDPHFLSGGL